jgi:hypothetical protein
MITRAEKIASLLFALFFAYFLKSTILGYATEPKVIGGIDFDQPIPQVMPWTPVFFPLLLSAAFGYWIWPTKSYPSLPRKMTAGSIALVTVTFVTLFISTLCIGFGAFYLTYPHLMNSEILPAIATTFFAAFQGTAIMGLFHGIAFVGFGVFFGCLIVLVSHGVASTASSVARAGLDSASPSGLLSSSSQWPWLSLLAGLVATAIVLAGLGAGGPFIIVMWVSFLLPWGIVWLAVGAAIGSVSEHWAWCVAVSLPVGGLSSMMHATPDGILASQSIDFPPILFAMLLGFALARKLLRPRAPQTAAG